MRARRKAAGRSPGASSPTSTPRRRAARRAASRPGTAWRCSSRPGADLTAVVYACWRIGAVVVVADAGLGARGLARALRGAWPPHVIAITEAWSPLARCASAVSASRRAAVGQREPRCSVPADPGRHRRARPGQAAARRPGPDDEAAVVFTSGSTGPAKGVVYRHRQVEATRDALLAHYTITPSDRLVAAFAPLAVLGPALGIASAIPDMDVTAPAHPRRARLADAVRAVGGTLVWASPGALRERGRHRGRRSTTTSAPTLGSVRLLLGAGAPVPAALLHAGARLCPTAEVHTPYGMTEVLPVTDIDLTGSRDRRRRATGDGVCVGRPVPGVRVAVSAARRDGVPHGDRSDHRGRHRRDRGVGAVGARSATTGCGPRSRARPASRGWHRTGDVGHLDAEGRLWVGGRLAHVVDHGRRPGDPGRASSRRVEAVIGSSGRGLRRRRARPGRRSWSWSWCPSGLGAGTRAGRSCRRDGRPGGRRSAGRRGPGAQRAAGRHPAQLQDRPGRAGPLGRRTRLS